ncbi:class I SAM-dependent methyltransferase [Rhizosphaericola mali]|uniref:Class I SAM-dependent methyltransferase n=1 Tax=Rhizosphaericola mali TaxID=2545455 RepID=A0A5P2GE76_9BACT|nr:class I SAM-dependent methyltransferase [Rhizosphaericola mali]QES89911.1 class I SAM-dependent methyltransferase [Rhizosphaericola mali]
MIDLPGIAIKNYFEKTSKAKLYVHDPFGPKVEMPISLYFRKEKHLPILEKKALELCKGNILDIGAGAGSHALILQEKKLNVTALEISPAACEVMQKRGVDNIICEDIFKYEDQKFSTLLLLMNGIGLCGNILGFTIFLKRAHYLLEDNGILLFDSCDIAYMYEEQDVPKDKYYGEVHCRYEYQKECTDFFNWLYLDKNTLREIAIKEGWSVEIIYEDENDQYLARLQKR